MKPTFAACMAAIHLAAGALLAPGSAVAADEDAARRTIRQNSCFRCHAFRKDKDGPIWSKVAEKYRGRANAEDHLMRHLTGRGMALFPDGHEEHHKAIRADRASPEEIRNLVRWILSL